MSEYQEIYNAPTDGTHILLFCDVELDWSIGYYNGDYWETVDGMRSYPTHWMYKPEPPKPE